ncbi:YlmC/YmxH family sporulation protein [Sporosalibacterium faouarense]|uniref:YlmC/YmxH family sporulation protein n=1 Tax=Sporosalibacterium faouarense TaxID=516123 RepID=UPI00192AEB04|nr:YlmC/YmxH family sporulation protein [Sporosalibacterium faouarense]
MVRTSGLREKEIVNVKDGTKLGLISDIEVNLEAGMIEAIIIPGPGKVLGLFGKNEDYVIKWEDIVRIGVHVILVDLKTEWDRDKEYRVEADY